MINQIEHVRYKQVVINGPYFFFIDSNLLDTDIEFIIRNEVENICLSQYENYSLIHIKPILNLKFIKRLEIYVNKVDLQGIDALENLEDLSIGEEYQNLKLTNLYNLKSLYVINGNPSGLGDLKNLKELTIVNGTISTFSSSNFQQNSSIESLSIYNTKGKIDFSFLQKMSALKTLDLYNIRSELDVRLFDSFSEKIQVLKIEKCKMIVHLEEWLTKFNSLNYLSLIDSVPLSSADVLLQAKSIEILVLLGTSFFINGDLGLLNFFKHVSIDNKKHYSLKNEQLPKLPVL